jgi:hypothetical protein
MIRVTEFVQNLLTGDVALVYLDAKIETPALDDFKVNHFNSVQSAKIALHKLQKDELTKDLTKLIVHCEAIINAGHREYQTKPKMDALDVCMRLKKWLNGPAQDCPLSEICTHIYTVRDCLEKILPHSKNPSYENSKKTFHQIIALVNENRTA